ncbi:hypothetical protein pqer_cds_1048 [Pandoravirus quercus]|uniref:Uncharacterized protein n=2 Tax=Pandoravirus TaxID=2060084 RepID=A0A2U7UAV2_9VIRU|nr:hypothetical protein pqer_cds_1048 [Pandoravirus quercus]AVK75470.1 hypothetical protein pqer_cds_1048 [Pandoravirus quercus]QBZ81650.1 hypothetical protein pclt_cds_1067 [Pandoravirus celtis]
MSQAETIFTYTRESRYIKAQVVITSTRTDDKGCALCTVHGDAEPLPGCGTGPFPHTTLSFRVHACTEQHATIQEVGAALKAAGLDIGTIMDNLLTLE